MPEPRPELTRARLHSIDFLRGLASLTVCGLHAMTSAAPPDGSETIARIDAALDQGAHLAVLLFFVISGFCIHLGGAREKRRTGRVTFHFRQFWARRFWRLYPTYLVVLCISMAVLVAAYFSRQGTEMLAPYPEPKLASLARDFFAHVFMLHGLSPVWDGLGGNPPLWTIAREEYLYLLYPVILLFRRKANILVSAVLVAAAGPALNYVRGSLGIDWVWLGMLATTTLNFWLIWYLGTAAAEDACGVVRLPAPFRWSFMVPVWLAVAYFYPAVGLPARGFACFTLVNFCVARELEGRWYANRIARAMTAIGVMSYSLYLVHSPVQTVMLSLSLKLGTFSTPFLMIIRAVVLAVGSYLAAWVLFRVVESRFLHRRTNALAVTEVDPGRVQSSLASLAEPRQ